MRKAAAGMEYVLRLKNEEALVSFVLIDWSCRESFHVLDYLADQTLPRRKYEIIWIEFYGRRHPEILRRIRCAQAAGAPAPVDTYAVMGMPESVCYHKHLMYDLGIALAAGRIVCIADSDAIVRPGFAASILEAFEENGPIVLHYDEVRNNDARFWPFQRPRLDDVTGFGCINWIDGRPLGLVDTTDPLHTRNYGACMCAPRADLIAIGGADLHIDYLGHICGPYELTFRLKNFGRRELWHPAEWLYHVWHPGQGGDRNFLGPHDGRHMSTRALELLRNGRHRPHIESPAIARLRSGGSIDERTAVEEFMPAGAREEWRFDRLRGVRRSYDIGGRRIESIDRERDGARAPAPPIMGIPLRRSHLLRLLPLFCRMLLRQLLAARGATARREAGGGRAAGPLRRLRSPARSLRRVAAFNRDRLVRCWRHLCYAHLIGASELILYGGGMEADVLCALARFLPVRIAAICPFGGADTVRRRGKPLMRLEDLARATQKIMLASFTDTARHLEDLARAGIPRERVIVLG